MVTFPGGQEQPSLGVGTWRMGESAAKRRAEVAILRTAIELGYRVIDTAEMYGEGGAEEATGQAIADALRAGDVRRDALFVISKVYPHNASRLGTIAACERSLTRLGLDYIDCYLLHWRGPVPLFETVLAFETLRAQGRIRNWGVSNFDLDDMQELIAIEGGDRCAANQVYYSLTAQGRSVRPLAVATRAGHCHDGIFADRPRGARAQQLAPTPCQTPRRHAGASRDRLAARANWGDAHCQGGAGRASRRELRFAVAPFALGRDRPARTTFSGPVAQDAARHALTSLLAR